MKFFLRIFSFILALISVLFAITSCKQDKEVVTEITWADLYEEQLINEFDFITDVLVLDSLDSRQLNVYVECTSIKMKEAFPVFEDFYDQIFNVNREVSDIIKSTNPYISITFHLKDGETAKYICNYPAKYNEKWAVYINNEFDSYFYFGEQPPKTEDAKIN